MKYKTWGKKYGIKKLKSLVGIRKENAVYKGGNLLRDRKRQRRVRDNVNCVRPYRWRTLQLRVCLHGRRVTLLGGLPSLYVKIRSRKLPECILSFPCFIHFPDTPFQLFLKRALFIYFLFYLFLFILFI